MLRPNHVGSGGASPTPRWVILFSKQFHRKCISLPFNTKRYIVSFCFTIIPTEDGAVLRSYKWEERKKLSYLEKGTHRNLRDSAPFPDDPNIKYSIMTKWGEWAEAWPSRPAAYKVGELGLWQVDPTSTRKDSRLITPWVNPAYVVAFELIG